MMSKCLRNTCWLACLIVFSAIYSVSVMAGEHEPHIDFSEHPHHFSVLLGHTELDKENGATIGLDYEYRLNDLTGIGAVVEYASGDLDAWTVLAVADIHLTHHWIVQVGPGVERTSEHNLFVARIGTLYEMEYGNWTLSPQLHFDYHDGSANALVYGVAIGFAF